VAVDAGDYRFLLKDVDGPAGASLLGRFAALDPGLLDLVRSQVAIEEALHPDRVYAEIVHLPEGRTGNVIARPHLRRYEIPFLGASGLPPDQQIPLSDLTVSVVEERIVLWSERLGREVQPRLTTAHNFTDGSLAIYRFLCDLQYQEADACAGWDWGPLRSSPFLPRVSLKRLVLARARWRLEPAAANDLRRAQGETGRWLAVQELRQRRRIPRWVVLSEGDNELTLDLDNVLCVEVLLGRLHPGAATTLIELFPAPDDLCLRDGAGHRFVHELLLTCRTTGAPPGARPTSPTTALQPRSITPAQTRRRFAPGSSWLYLRLYGGEALADDLLTGPLEEFTAQVTAGPGPVDRWFFIRYNDDEPHLRIRWRARSGAWPPDAIRQLESVTAKALDDGLLNRVEISTYERETERYGGPSGIGPAEQIFCIDSEAVTAILRLDEGDGLAQLRARAAVLGTDRLLDDLGLVLDERLAWAQSTSAALQAEFGGGGELVQSLGLSFRTRRDELTELLANGGTGGLAEVMAERSRRMSPIAKKLRALAADRGLTRTLPEMAGSYVHMYLNRLLRSDQRASEMVVADSLSRLYRAAAARARPHG
jgi:lantibiotic biosynthesis protein